VLHAGENASSLYALQAAMQTSSVVFLYIVVVHTVDNTQNTVHNAESKGNRNSKQCTVIVADRKKDSSSA
jgi:hypothetical protein